MSEHLLSLEETESFSPLMLDLMAHPQWFSDFISDPPSLASFGAMMEKIQMTEAARQLLYERLEAQYEGHSQSALLQANIKAMLSSNSYCVVTGHQLNLLGGPAYFVYKILHTISLADALNKEYKDKRVVPVFWMATEDHDFEEINHFHFYKEKITWDTQQQGAVGRFHLEGLSEVLAQFEDLAGKAPFTEEVMSMLHLAYSKPNLAEATRCFVNAMFGRFGLVVIDGDDAILKRSFAPRMQKELFEGVLHPVIESQSARLVEMGYKAQAHPREINLFYLSQEGRHRIIHSESGFSLVGAHRNWTRQEMEVELAEHPDHFSPNALFRPIYQESILPNLAYVGGGGELAYWMQLKNAFTNMQLDFPLLILRKSFLLLDANTRKRMQKLELSERDLFREVEALIKDRLIEKHPLDFSEEEQGLLNSFARLADKMALIDPSLRAAVGAESAKMNKVFQQLEKKAQRSVKAKEEVEINQLRALKSKLFPGGTLQERRQNFMEVYLFKGPAFLDELLALIDPLEANFICLDY